MAEKAKENKVEFGLKNAYYAIITDDGTKLDYAAPVKLPGAVELSIDPEGSSDPFYADDSVYYTAVSNQGYSGKMTVARLNAQFNQDVFGDTVDDATGMQVDNTDAQPKPFALLFEFSGDKSKTRHVLFNVTATRPSIGSKTKEDKIEVNTQELSFTAAADPYASRSHGKIAEGEKGYDNFFKAVVVPGATGTAPAEVKATGIKASDATTSIKVGATKKVSVTAEPANATDADAVVKAVTYKSSAEGVATVAADGTITAVKEGSADITATSGSFTVTVKVTVTAA